MSTTNLAVRTRLPKKNRRKSTIKKEIINEIQDWGRRLCLRQQAPNADRIETILSTSDFFRATSTRRKLVQRILATGRGVAVGGAVGVAVLSRGPKSARAADDPVMDFGNAAVGAERIGIAFYSNALG